MTLKGEERGCEAAGRVGRGWDYMGISKEELYLYIYIFIDWFSISIYRFCHCNLSRFK